MNFLSRIFPNPQSARCSGVLPKRTDGLLLAFALALVGTCDVYALDETAQDPTLFQAAVRETEPLSPARQQETFSLPDGFRISCFASEPDLQKPMNMAFDADGRLWVTGSNQYPLPAKQGEGSDSVRILEDTNSDGIADRITVFADNLNIPIGLLPYQNGVIVFSIPDILYLEDTDADGKADKRTKLYGPFDTSRDTHGMTNSFTTFHDGWVYACHGFNNQSTVAGSDGHSITMHSGNTYRFRPDGSRIEIWSRGQVNPFGMTCDDVADLFTSDCHSKPVNLLMRGGYHESFGKPHDGLGFIPNVMTHQHGSTAIDAVCWIDSQSFPESIQGNLLLGNVMTGRVHRNRIIRNGASVSMQEEDDFVVCSDPWFRPVDIQSGPDGAIYIADFYNRIIGHYEVPLEHPGRDRRRGRIWKVEYVGDELTANQHVSGVEKLSDLPPQDLLQQLNDPRLQIRMRATDLLVEAADESASLLIREAWEAASGAPESVATSHLLWVLARTNSLQPEDLQMALDRGKRQLKIHAMKVCSEQPSSDELANLIKQGLKDSDPLVQRSAADAASVHHDVILFKELVNVLTVSPTEDVHLRHAARIALRNQLTDASVVNWFLKDTQPQAAYLACRSVVEGLQTEQTAELTLAILKNTKQPPSEVAVLIGHAAATATGESVSELVRFAARLERADVDQLIRIRQVLADALASNSNADLTEFQAFEASLLDQLVADISVEDLRWGRYHWDDRPAGTWGTEERQRPNSSTSRFLSSLPGSEAAVSVLRSKSFVVPFQLQLELCGHLGPPNQPPISDNQLILRESHTGVVLRAQQPPRNDQATRVMWKLVDVVGKRAVLELHDGIDLRAYAWLALGPMSPSVAHASAGQQQELQERLLTIVRILETRSQHGMLQQDHLKLLRNVVLADQVNGQTRQEAASVLFDQYGLEEISAFSVLLKYGRVSLPVQNLVANACATPEPWVSTARIPTPVPGSSELIFQPLPSKDEVEDEEKEVGDPQTPVMKRSAWIRQTVKYVFSELPEFYRDRLAAEMATSPKGAKLLVEAIKAGIPSAAILRNQSLVSSLQAHDKLLAAEIDQLVEKLPREETVPSEYVSSVLKQLRNSPTTTDKGTLEAGRILFERHCLVCHRRGSKGGQAGPQLDGIRTRGTERILEDILYPHRNVDMAFRTSVVVLKSGKTISGLYRLQQNEQNAAIVKADGTIQEVAVQDIEELRQTQQSLMPAGFHKLLSETDMVNLLKWLSNSL